MGIGVTSSEASRQQAHQMNFSLYTILFFWCALVIVSSVYVTTPLYNVFSLTYEVGTATSTWVSGSFSFCYAIGFLFFGILANRLGSKEIIVLGLALLTLITFIIGFIDHFVWLVILRGIQGFVAATFAPTALAYVFELFPARFRITAIGFMSFGYVTAGIFGQVIAEIVNTLFHWQAVFLLFGCFYFVTYVAVRRILPKTAHTSKEAGLQQFVQGSAKIFQQRDFQLCYGITFLLLLTFIGMYTVLEATLTNAPYFLSDRQVLFVRAIGIIGMVASLVANHFVRRLGIVRALRMAIGIAVLGLLCMGLGQIAAIVVGASVVFVFGISLVFPLIMMYIGKIGGEHRAISNAWYAFILFVGATIGPLIAVTLMEMGSISSTFVGLAAILSVGLVLSALLKE